MNLPWKVAVYDARVLIIDGADRKITEIIPAQIKGRVPTTEECRAYADFICERVNAWPTDSGSSASEAPMPQSGMPAGSRNGKGAMSPREACRFLAQRRRALGLSRKEVWMILGINSGLLSAWEAGRREPRWSSLERWARALGMTIEFDIVPTEPPGDPR